MASQSYCSRTDIENIMGPAAVLASIDDDQDQVESAADTAALTAIIDRAANEMNQMIRHQYVLADVAGNDWLVYAQATIVVYRLRTRRNNPAEGSVEEEYRSVMRLLKEVRWGREQLPDQSPSYDHLPSVSNFSPQLFRQDAPIRVSEEESTTTAPVGNRKRNTSGEAGFGNF